jgi:hypothetical protein
MPRDICVEAYPVVVKLYSPVHPDHSLVIAFQQVVTVLQHFLDHLRRYHQSELNFTGVLATFSTTRSHIIDQAVGKLPRVR